MIKTKKGFSLAEMVAVIAILMVLAALSLPYVRGYIDDSYNGKALIYMRELNEARLNFERDYPGTTVTGSPVVTAGTNDCNIDDIYNGGTLNISVSTIQNCHYLLPISESLNDRYTFEIGGDCDIEGCSNAAVSMTGGDAAGKYKDKCACIDSLGRVYKQQ